jgi:methionine aminopeptidase
MITRKSRDEIKKMRHAGHIVALVHKKMREVIEPGISTKELDSIALSIIKENKAIPTFLASAIISRYPFPYSALLVTFTNILLINLR